MTPIEKRNGEETEEEGEKRSRVLPPSWRLEAVLTSREEGEVAKVGVVVVEVHDKKMTSQLVKKLQELAPLEDLQHLKRVKSSKDSTGGRVQVLLWKLEVQKEDGDLQTSTLSQLASLGLPTSCLGQVTQEQVAAWQPVSRAQYDELRTPASHWPSHFHEDKHLESLLAGTHQLWGEEARLEQGSMLELAGREGGVVVDGGRVVAQGRGSPHHPLAHTAMVLVDLVARSQGGGAWPFTGAGEPGMSYSPGQERGEASLAPHTGPYLCTGYTVYLAREPCHLCAMALLHSRVARLVYRLPSTDGALVTRDRLLERKGLNHKFLVLRVVGEGGRRGGCS